MRNFARPILATFALIWTSGPVAAQSLAFVLPIDCDAGKTCFVQNYVDVQTGPDARDYLCGNATYDGHTGTDIRLLDVPAASKGVVVRAAAPGVVAKTREGVADHMVETEADAERVTSYGLGNAVIIDHGDGWQTIYGHLRKGSLKVRSGDSVEAGAPIGLVGLSGLTEFPHVHFEVRHNGKLVEPFTGQEEGTGCKADLGRATAGALWEKAIVDALASTETRILQVGFAGASVSPKDLESGLQADKIAGPTSAGLVFYARLMNMHEGDQLHFVLDGPGDWQQDHATAPIDRAKATYVGFAGKKLTAKRWPAGRYIGRVELYRAGRMVAAAEDELTLPE
ncbi:MAG: M23 family metallopeptidase [Hyphomicrobiaceae bacterium]